MEKILKDSKFEAFKVFLMILGIIWNYCACLWYM